MSQINPHSIEAERLVLGQALVDNSVIDQIAQYKPEEQVFYTNQHQQIWKSILDMHRDGAKVIDVVTITSKIPPNQNNESSAFYLTGLTSDVVTTENAEQYAKVIYEKWLLRKVIKQSDKIRNVMALDGDDAYQLLQRLHREIEDILNLRVREDFTLDGLVDEAIENMLSTNNLVNFGISQLDDLTGGMTKGEITVIAGRPGHFKTTTMINIVKQLIDDGKKVLVFNREMSNVEMMKKIIILESETLSYGNMRMGHFDDDANLDLDKAKEIVKEKYVNLTMFDDVFDIDRAMRELRKSKPDVVVDDYIGLIDVIGVDDNRLRIDNIMKQYKRAAKTYDCAALLLSQLNRGCEERANKRPILRDLRDSGSIEQDAEMVLFMYYDYRYNYKDSNIGEHGIEIILGKNRYGKTGSVLLGVIGDRCNIVNKPEDAVSLLNEINNKRLKNGKKTTSRDS